jgi:hypothetical protein
LFVFNQTERESGSDNFENCLAFEIPKEKTVVPTSSQVTEDLCNLVGELIQGINNLGES